MPPKKPVKKPDKLTPGDTKDSKLPPWLQPKKKK